MRTINVLWVVMMVITSEVAVADDEINVECSCRISPANTVDWAEYVANTTVPNKNTVTEETLKYVCYQQRSLAQGACMEGNDRDSSLQYYKGKLQ